MSTIWEFLKPLIAAIASSGGTWLLLTTKSKNKIKEMEAQAKIDKEKADAERKEYQNNMKLIKDEISGMASGLAEVKIELKQNRDNIQFNTKLMNTMKRQARYIVDANVSLKPSYKYVLLDAAEEFEKYADFFYNNDLRGIQHEIEPDLELDLRRRLRRIDNNLYDLKEPIRSMSYSTGKIVPIVFLDYINTIVPEDNNLNESLTQITDKLLQKLKLNGLSQEEVVSTFSQFIVKYLKTFSALLIQWERLKVYDTEDDEVIEKRMYG